MARKPRNIVEPETPVVEPEPEVVVPPPPVVEVKIPFKVWFNLKVASDPRLQPHHAAGMKAYMAGLGLHDIEPAWRYDAGLSQYFG